MYKSIALALLIAVTAVTNIKAADPSIRLEGNGKAVEYPLSTHNRVYFNSNYMMIGSHTNTSMQPLTWAYSTYNVIRLTQLQSSITPVSNDRPVLTYVNTELRLSSENPETLSCTVYDSKGALVISDNFDSYGVIATDGLPKGIYFATAAGSSERHTVKFIIR